MIHKKFRELKLSNLGMGAMRLPVIDGKDGQIDEEAAAKMVAAAMEGGVNYYDTAWGYHGGNSELVMGRLLSKYPRESFHLATKFPSFDLADFARVEEIFEKQLEKCQVDYVDFYLLHNLSDRNLEAYLDEQCGVIPYLLKQKERGRIKHFGFSTHIDLEGMRRFLDMHGEHMEFCQIQLNYIDWSFQRAEEKVALLNERGIPVWVMEPLRGGKLATLPEESAAGLKALRPDEGVPAWGFRFLQSIPGVTVILSGMSTLEQVEDNLHTFETDRPLNETEMAALLEVAKRMLSRAPCTACRYCTANCPQELDIPVLLELFNEHTVGGTFSVDMRMRAIPEDKRPSACIGCRSCEAMCPQLIKISEVLADFAAALAQQS